MAINERPAVLNVTNAAELARRVTVMLRDVHGEPFSAAAYAGFHGRLRNETTGEEVELAAGVSSLGENVLELGFPALGAGTWKYEVWATTDGGTEDRFIIGIYTTLDAVVPHSETADTPYTATLVVGEDNAVISAQFHATTEAQLWAQQAEASVGKIDEALDNLDDNIRGRVERIIGECTDESAENAARAAQSAQDASGSATSAAGSAEAAAASATAAAGSASAAQGYAAETDENVRVANAFLAEWRTNVYTLIWVGDNGHWYVGLRGSEHSIDTGIEARGESGRSPIIGTDKCWWVWNLETESYECTGVAAVPEDGKSPYINSLGHWVQWDAASGEYVDTGVRAQGKDGLNGTQIVRLLVDTYEDIPTEGPTCCGGYYYYVPLEEPTETAFYAEYAWIESAGGTAGWVRVGEVNDIAASNVYGLVKLAMDAIVVNGAPVGVTEYGQLGVPSAGTTIPGAVKLSVHDQVSNDLANIGMRADGKIAVVKGDYSRAGVVQLSSGETDTETADMRNIALTNTGRIVARRATRVRFGTVKLGSDMSTLNPIPYQHGISCTTVGELANNLLYSGAIQHRKRASWIATGSGLAQELAERFEPDASGSYFNSTDFYMGLLTTDSFTQNAVNGLTLEHATDELLGGVTLGSVSSGAEDSVPTGSTVYTYLQENYFDKGYIEGNYWTSAQIQEWAANTPVTDVWVQGKLNELEAQVENEYLKTAAAAATYKTIASASADKTTLEQSIAATETRCIGHTQTSVSSLRQEMQGIMDTSFVMRGNSGISQLRKITAEQFERMSSLNPDTLYIVTA